MDASALPPPVRAIRSAVETTAAAVAAQDVELLDGARAALAACDPEGLRLVLGEGVRLTVERSYPQGLDGDDARDLIERCARSALAWMPDPDVTALVLALTGALSLQDPDEDPRLPLDVIAVHAILLAAELGAGPARVRGDLDAAIDHLATTRAAEMP